MELVLPLTLARSPPPHRVCSINIDVRRSGSIATGDGETLFAMAFPFQWRFSLRRWSRGALACGCSQGRAWCAVARRASQVAAQNTVTPHVILCGAVQPVASVVHAPIGAEEQTWVLVGRDGAVSHWESCACLYAQPRATLLRPRMAVLLSDGTHIALAGGGSEIEVVSLLTHDVVLTVQHGHQAWISHLQPLRHLGTRHERRAPVLASVSEEGLVVFWSLDLHT